MKRRGFIGTIAAGVTSLVIPKDPEGFFKTQITERGKAECDFTHPEIVEPTVVPSPKRHYEDGMCAHSGTIPYDYYDDDDYPIASG